MTAPTRPVLRYHGGKFRLRKWIISHFPEHRVYVEPFGGGGSVLMGKPRAAFELYNDLDADIVNLFRVLRSPRAGELREQLRLTPFSRREFFATYDETPDDVVERARRTVVRGLMGYGTTSRRKNRTGFRAKCARPQRGGGISGSTGVGDWRTYPDAIATFAERLRGVVIEERDAFEVIAQHDGPDTLFYVDPPYPISTRTSIRSEFERGRAYAHDLTDDDHRRLASVLCRVQGAVVLSGYPCEMYDDELYSAWERHEKATMADRQAKRMEVLWVKAAGVTMPAPARDGRDAGSLFAGESA